MKPPAVSLRRQLILWNALTLTVLLAVLGMTTRLVAITAIMHSVDQHLEDRVHQPGPPHDNPFYQGDHFRPGSQFGQNRPPDDMDMGGPGPPPDQTQGGPMQEPPLSGRQDPNPPRRFTLQGHSLDHPARKPLYAAALADARQGRMVFSTVTVGGEHLRVLTQPTPSGGLIQVSYPLADVDQAIAGLDRALLLLIPVALLCAGVGGAALTSRVLRPVRQITQAAANMGDTASARLPAQGEDEFAKMAETFNGLLERLDASFQKQARLLEQQRRFTADASHELKTPLTAILGTASQPQYGGMTQDDYRQSMTEITESAKVMACLVQDLLLLARSDEGRMGNDSITVLACDVLQQALSRIPKGGAPVTLRINDESLALWGNEEELVRLFSNLLQNAARATPPTGGIFVSAARRGQDVTITIVDTGIGIAPEHLAHLGERFYRVDAARARRDGGTGLGLAICRSIVEAHGGTMTFASAPGKGTTVTVTLKIGLTKDKTIPAADHFLLERPKRSESVS